MFDIPVSADVDQFSKAAKEWLCQSYHVEFRYVAEIIAGDLRLVHASVHFYPWIDQDPAPYTFHIEAGGLVVGQQVFVGGLLAQTMLTLDEALMGRIEVGGQKMALASTNQLHYIKERTVNEWANQLRITLTSNDQSTVNISPTLDDDLRQAEIPFDGYTDVISWLGIPDFRLGASRSVTVIVNAPAQMALNECKLSDGTLQLAIDAQSSVDVKSVGVALIGYPPAGVTLRKQLGKTVAWREPEANGRLRGHATISLPNVGSAFVALSIGTTYVQRHYFVDPTTSRNVRYIAAQQFDQGLQKVEAKLNANDSRSFEKAIAALLFMSGFAPMLPLNDDSPDIIAITPGGQIAIIECTLKTPDTLAKIGNLVARREALLATFKQGGHSAPLMAVLVCQSPRAQITVTDEELAKHDVLLITQENLTQHFVSIRNPIAPDDMYARGRARLDALKAASQHSAMNSG